MLAFPNSELLTHARSVWKMNHQLDVVLCNVHMANAVHGFKAPGSPHLDVRCNHNFVAA